MPPRRTRVTSILERCANELQALSEVLLAGTEDDPERQFGLREAVPTLSGLLVSRPKIATVAAKTLANISNSEVHGADGRAFMVEHGTIHNLIHNLRPESEATLEALYCLRSLAGYSVYKRTIVEHGALACLVELLQSASSGPLVMAVVDLLDRVCNFTNSNKDALHAAGGVGPLVALLESARSVAPVATVPHDGKQLENTALVGVLLPLLNRLALRDGCRDALHRAGAIPILMAIIRDHIDPTLGERSPIDAVAYASHILGHMARGSSTRARALIDSTPSVRSHSDSNSARALVDPRLYPGAAGPHHPLQLPSLCAQGPPYPP